ncbi:MAG: hypothetical protein AAF703_08125 [Cyanobacteria bacterium P01_D01_bin.105]
MSSSNPKDKLAAIFAAFWKEISPKVDAYAIPAIQGRIEDWVGKQPELTEVLCKYAVKYAPQMTEGRAESTVDTVVHEEILKDWKNSLAGPHLRKIQDAVLSHSRRDSLLISYIRILQQGELAADNSVEQADLLASGLIRFNDGRLRVSNKLYAKVFNLAWVENQIPGITKPVVIVDEQQADGSAPSASAKLYSKLAIAACVLALFGAAVSSYIRESGGEAMATPEELIESAASGSVSDGASSAPATASATAPATAGTSPLTNGVNGSVAPPESAVGTSDRERFDLGEDHAKNSRWIKMMREFCAISPSSVYFTPAQKDLARWKELYREDLVIAIDVVSAEQGQCAIYESPAEN